MTILGRQGMNLRRGLAMAAAVCFALAAIGVDVAGVNLLALRLLAWVLTAVL